MKRMFKSKRFVAFAVSLTTFIVMLIVTDYPPVDIAMSITMIVSVYIGGDSLRSSYKNNSEGEVG